jgi:hypothetical protein
MQNDASNGASATPRIMKNKEGDKYLDLGKKKRATVRSFKGISFIDIREYYGDDGDDLKPGKKGIALQLDQVPVCTSPLRFSDAIIAVGDAESQC